jgi:hypothetical protein
VKAWQASAIDRPCFGLLIGWLIVNAFDRMTRSIPPFPILIVMAVQMHCRVASNGRSRDDQRASLAKRSRQAGARANGAKRVWGTTRARAAEWRFAPLLRQCPYLRYFFAPLMVSSLAKIQWRKTG